MCSLLGLGPLPLQETVAAVLHRDSGDHGTGTQVSGAATGILILTVLLQALEGVKADDSHDDDGVSPVSLDLYILVIMMSLSVLFLWESGKHCVRMCCARRIAEDVHVNMVRHDEDQVRRSRRQEAVRRAIEREAGELRFRGSSLQPSEEVSLPTEREVPRTSLDVSVNLTAQHHSVVELPPHNILISLCEVHLPLLEPFLLRLQISPPPLQNFLLHLQISPPPLQVSLLHLRTFELGPQCQSVRLLPISRRVTVRNRF